MGYRFLRVIVKRVCGHQPVLTSQFYVIVEHSLTSFSVILSPICHQAVFPVYQGSAFIEIGSLIKSVVIQTIC